MKFPDSLVINDLVSDVSKYSDSWRSQTTRLAYTIAEAFETRAKPRFIVAIGGPSGSSKSTTAAVLVDLLHQLMPCRAVHVGLDGYHLPQSVLQATEAGVEEFHVKSSLEGTGKLIDHKGRFDTYDENLLRRDLKRFAEGAEVHFPLYSRIEHDPVPELVFVPRGTCILVLAGLWLLYNKPPFEELLNFYDFTVFSSSSPEFLQKNTVSRHIQGRGQTEEEAMAFYEQSDTWNTKEILANIAPHDYDFYPE